MDIKIAIDKVIKGVNLTERESMEVMSMIMDGKVNPAQTSCFLTALRMKSESLDEMVGCAKALQSESELIKPANKRYIDLVGTGGDGINTFNISTTTVFVVAAAGVAVAKNGNRAVSSRSGSADVLEALGVNIMLDTNDVEKCVEEIGIGFMFAQKYIPKMKNVSPIRKEMGIRTVFNILGPLLNPSGAETIVVGVFNPKLTNPYAQTLQKMGIKRGIVMSGLDGMDEFTISDTTVVSEIEDGKIIDYTIIPEQFGFKRANKNDLVGGDARENAVITKEILMGRKGGKRDIVLLNSAYGIYAGGGAKTIEEGIQKAEFAIDSGAAYEKLESLVEFTNKFSNAMVKDY